ncbi:MAG: hypothetical protein ABIZ52_00220 [Candidatus Limnocylindrales bacterium]
MNKRNLASILWFVAGWQGGALLVGLLGLPTLLAFAPGIVMAVVVRWDPTGIFWSRSAPSRRIRPINEFAAELERRAAQGDKRIDHWPVVETDTTRV